MSKTKNAIILTILVSLFTVFSLHNVAQAVPLKGQVKVDGSSTVFPITEAVAEEFGKKHPEIRVIVGMSGTGGGFKKFALGEIDINNASRTIKDSEAKAAKEKGIDSLEVPVGYDGITIVVNKQNNWVDKLTVAELKKLWEPGSTVKTWKDLRATWPDRKIKLYGPGTDSGTFDFFTEVINGKSQASRSDFTKSEDDNVLVQGVEGDKDSLGYFGYAYYVANKEKLKEIPIDNGKGPILPTIETIMKQTYAPLSRTIYIYVSKNSAVKRSEVKLFVQFYINSAFKLVKEVGYIPLSIEKYKAVLADFDKAVK